MIQDITPYRFNNRYMPDMRPDGESQIVFFNDGKLLLKIDAAGEEVSFPKLKEISPEKIPELTYLFYIDEDVFFLADTLEMAGTDILNIIPKGYSFYELRRIMSMDLEPKRYMFAAFTAYQLADWYVKNIYCGHCGTKVMKDLLERAVVCPKCRNKIYPRINPAVIVGITNGDRLLLTKYRTGFAHNALVAGFAEIGETIEETVMREVMEETGLMVKNIRYYKSQPWGIASDLLIGFFCDVDGNDTIHMDKSELKYAEWVKRENIELQPYDYSLTNEMMRIFKESKENSETK